jgi:hypothetical protein
MNANIINIIDSLVVFILDITIPQGSKKLRPEDLAINGIDITKLPPSAISTLGSKRFISPKDLAPFQAMKRAAERQLAAYGSRFLRGYAVPEDRAEELNNDLLGLKKQFEDQKEVFLNRYEEAIEAWITQNPPEWANMIKSAVDSPIKVARGLTFGFAPVKITSPPQLKVDDDDHGNSGLEEQASGLFGQLCHEIRMAAKTAFEESFVGKASVSRKALRPISAIREKLLGLAFLDPSCSETIASIDETLAKIPKNGPIEKTDLDMVAGLVGRRLANFGRTLPVEPEPEPEIEEVEPEPEIVLAAIPQPQQIAPLAWDF